MNNIQEMSSQTLRFLKGLIIIIPLSAFTPRIPGCAFNINAAVLTPEGITSLQDVAWTTGSLTIGIFAQLLSIAPLMMGLFVLHTIFSNYFKGEIFSVRNALHYSSIAHICFWDALLISGLSRTLLLLATTFSNPPSYRYFSEAFGAPNLLLLGISLILGLISQVMLEGSRLQEEKNLTV